MRDSQKVFGHERRTKLGMFKWHFRRHLLASQSKIHLSPWGLHLDPPLTNQSCFFPISHITFPGGMLLTAHLMNPFPSAPSLILPVSSCHHCANCNCRFYLMQKFWLSFCAGCWETCNILTRFFIVITCFNCGLLCEGGRRGGVGTGVAFFKSTGH